MANHHLCACPGGPMLGRTSSTQMLAESAESDAQAQLSHNSVLYIIFLIHLILSSYTYKRILI